MYIKQEKIKFQLRKSESNFILFTIIVISYHVQNCITSLYVNMRMYNIYLYIILINAATNIVEFSIRIRKKNLYIVFPEKLQIVIGETGFAPSFS